MNSIYKEDLLEIVNSNLVDWNEFNDKTFFITGSTGLIGSIIVNSVLLRNKDYGSNIKLKLLVRDIEKAKGMFEDLSNIELIQGSVENSIIVDNIDYIIHAASPTKSKFLTENPVETIDSAVIGTKNILEIAKYNCIKSMVYLSSMEVYGTIDNDNVIEKDLGFIDLNSTRSSYPESKRMCELYCYSYFKEYNVPVKSVRLAQTFGAGISKQENRVFKYFADCILNKEDIVLKSSGNTKINFCYTTDAIIGILFTLLKGQNGESYNIVSENQNMTIADSAKWLMQEFGSGEVKFEIDESSNNFAPENAMILSNEKIKQLGWTSKYTIKDGYIRLLEYLKEDRGI